MAANPALDAKRVVLAGRGDGGEIARKVQGHGPTRIAAVVALPESATDDELFAETLRALERNAKR